MEVIKKKMNTLRGKLDTAEVNALEAEEDYQVKLREAEAKEEEAAQLSTRLAELEDDLDLKESTLNELRGRYDEALKHADENERAHIELRNRGQTDTTKLEKLQNELHDLLDQNDKLEAEYQEVIAQLEDNEGILDEEEDRLAHADQRVKELEVEAVQSGNLLRSMEINENVAARSYSKSDLKVVEMQDRLDEMNTRAAEKESEAKDLEDEIITIEDGLSKAKVEYHAVKTEYDSLMAEVAEI